VFFKIDFIDKKSLLLIALLFNIKGHAVKLFDYITQPSHSTFFDSQTKITVT